MTTTDMPSPVDGLRDRLAEALITRITQSIVLPPTPGMVGQPFAATERDLADAVLAELGIALAEEWQDWVDHGCQLRTCTIPSCLRQFDLVASWTREGKEAAPEHLRSKGWLQSRTVGFACPEHAQALWATGDGPHNPNWHRDDTRRGGAVLRCSCGWDAGDTRFRGHGTVLWQAHALEVLEATGGPVPEG